MSDIARALYSFFARLGGFGLFGLGVLDSSFLVMPLGKDLLMVGLTARNPSHAHVLYYSAMAAAGTMIGALLLDVIFRKAGEKGLQRHLGPKRLEYVKRKVTGKAAWALTLASLAPPPFPFTPFIMGAAALQYSRRKLLLVVGSGRFVRYVAIGYLATIFGKRILRWAEMDIVQWVVIGLVILSLVAGIVSVVHWIQRSRKSSVYTEAI